MQGVLQAVFLGLYCSCCTMPMSSNLNSWHQCPFIWWWHATLRLYTSEPDCREVGQANSLHYWHWGLDVIKPSETQHREDAVHNPGHVTAADKDDSRFSLSEEESHCHIRKRHVLELSSIVNWPLLFMSWDCHRSDAQFLSTVTASYHSAFAEWRSSQDLGLCIHCHPTWLLQQCALWHHKDPVRETPVGLKCCCLFGFESDKAWPHNLYTPSPRWPTLASYQKIWTLI